MRHFVALGVGGDFIGISQRCIYLGKLEGGCFQIVKKVTIMLVV